MGIDVGSSSVKAAVFHAGGSQVGLVSREYHEVYPRPGWKEIDPEVLWSATACCIHEALGQTGIKPVELRAISISSRGEEVIPIGARGKPLYNFITATDRRDGQYGEIIDLWRRTFDLNELYEKTGVTLTILPSVHRMAWIRLNQPRMFEKVHKFCCVEDFLVHRLSGRFATDFSMAGRTMVFNRHTLDWDADVMEAAGIRREQLSEAVVAGTSIGKVTQDAARETGLSPETLVVVGGHDQCVSALGTGVVEAGEAFNGLGTVESVGMIADEPVIDHKAQEKHQACYPYVLPGKFMVLGLNMAYGLAIRWLRDNLLQSGSSGDKESFVHIMAAASRAPKGCHGLLFLPHFQGSSTGVAPAFNPKSRACLLGLREYHTADDICRAVLEGLCHETVSLLESMESSRPVRRLRATGGPSKSDFLMQLKSNVTGREISIPSVRDAGVTGAAVLAGVGAGIYRSAEEAVRQFCAIEKTYVPDKSEHEYYQRLHEIYRTVYPALLGIFEEVDRFGFESGGRE